MDEVGIPPCLPPLLAPEELTPPKQEAPTNLRIRLDADFDTFKNAEDTEQMPLRGAGGQNALAASSPSSRRLRGLLLPAA